MFTDNKSQKREYEPHSSQLTLKLKGKFRNFKRQFLVYLLITFSILLTQFASVFVPTVYAATLSVNGKAKVLNTNNSYLDFTLYNSNVKVDDGTGVFSGYAWLEDMGWVAFGTADNADGPVTLNLTTGAVTGKAKVLNTDGFLYFTTNNSNVTVALSTGVFSGYVWSEDVGWIDFTDTGVSSASFLPTAPSGLSGTADSTTAITWSWTDNSGNETGFRVDDSSNNNKSGNLAAGATSWQETGLAANTSYTRHVHAFNAIGDGTASGDAIKITLSTAPTGSNITGSQAISTWTNNSSFVFTNTLNFGAGSVQYFRYVWDTSSTHTWTESETQWTSGTLTKTATSDSNSWYLHLKGYNSADVANGTVDLGPYYYDSIAPIFSSKTTFTGWYTSNQTSTFTYTDSGGSGIASGTPVECIISTAGLAQTCSITPNVCDTAGNCNTTLVTSNGADIDKTAPTTGSIGYTNGYFTSASVPLTVDDGTDGGSGISTATRTFQRQSASLILGICGIYGSFSLITPDPTVAYPNFTDTTVVSGNCYKYEYQVSDTAGNQATYTSGNAARIDTSNPSAPGTPSTTNPNNSSSQNWIWVAATDAISNVANYLWRTTGTAIASGSSAVNSVATTLGDGLYNFFVKAVDTAGNQGAESSVSNIRIDTTAPSVPGTPATASLTTINKPVWTWTASTDSGSGLATTPYSVQWCGNSSFTGCDSNTDTSTTNSYTHATALADGTWYFRVKATDTANNSSAYSSNGTDTINTATTSTNNSNSSSSNTSSTSTPSCTDQAPGAKAPWLYGAIAQDSGSVLLYFTEADNPVNKYVLEFGTKSGDYPYGVQDMGINIRGQMTYLVKSLSSGTTYYFKVRGGNGCATGSWSNEISATTKGIVSFNQLDITSSQLETVPAEQTQPTINNSCQSYTVKSGDNLWSIAKNLLGDGNKYKDIIDQNKESYLSLENSNSIIRGWELKINCGNQPTQPTTETPKTTTKTTQQTTGYDVKVRVVDTEKKPVEGATVTLHSTPQTTKTDKNGVASFSNVEAGDHKVLIAYNNFEGEQSINLTGNVKEFDLNVTVQQKTISLSPLAYGIIGIMALVIFSLVVLLIKVRKSRV